MRRSSTVRLLLALLVLGLHNVPEVQGVQQQHADGNVVEPAAQETTLCYSTARVTWLNGNEGRIFMRDHAGGLHHLRLKGVSWHGFDTDLYSLNGLDHATMENTLISLQERR